jgi:protein TonB
VLFKRQNNSLNTNSKLFFLLGLVNSLLIIYYLLELRTPYNPTSTAFNTEVYDIYDEEQIPITKIKNEVKVSVKVIDAKTPITTLKPTLTDVSNPIFDNIKIVSNDTEITESTIETTEIGEKEAIAIKGIHYKDIEEVIIEEEVVEDVPFYIIEKAPVYPGCTGDNKQLKKCLEQSIREYVAENFDVNLAQDLGLSVGRKRIFVMFVIDKKGQISNIKSRAPHKRLQKEAERVIKSLPKMKPGKQRGRPVGVKYTVPIIFDVR